MAIRWHFSDKWKQCTIRVAPGNRFCYHHGGEKPPKQPPKPYAKKSDDPKWVRDRLQSRYMKLIHRRDAIEAEIADVKTRLEALSD